jgi:hypothetical protein
LKHPLGTVYVISAEPVATPVTTPPADVTEAIALLLLVQAPDGVVFDKVRDPPTAAVNVPVMLAGAAFTVLAVEM